jgi:hypothetical protein
MHAVHPHFAADIALRRKDVPLHLSGHIVDQNGSQPGQKLVGGAAVELLEVSMGVEIALLNDVGRVEAGAEFLVQLRGNQQFQVVFEVEQQLAEAFGPAEPRRVEKLLGIKPHRAGHAFLR